MDSLQTGKPKLGISACLLGQKVRYDGGHKRDSFVAAILSPLVDWMPVCPELEVGMGVPREPVRLVGSGANPRMVAERSGTDWTEAMRAYAVVRLGALKKLSLCGYILKKDSPSCGMERVRLYHGAGAPSKGGRGLFATALMETLPLLPVEEEGRLHDPKLRENFIDRVFAYQRWNALASEPKSPAALVGFHTRHKFLLLAHSERHYRELGRLVAQAKQLRPAHAYETYGNGFMAALAVHATPRKHGNVLEHMLGYFSQTLDKAERREMIGLIRDYRRGLVPLIVPVTLIKHYVNKYAIGYLRDQVYLDPSPRELMLRNHV